MELMRRVRRNMNRLSRSGNGALTTKGHRKLPFQYGERLFEIVAMRRRSSTRRNMHVDQTIPPRCIVA
jgi:hypothetical protein